MEDKTFLINRNFLSSVIITVLTRGKLDYSNITYYPGRR